MAAWICFYDRKDIFRGFLERVLRLKEVWRTIPTIFIFRICVIHIILSRGSFQLRGVWARLLNFLCLKCGCREES